MRKRFYVAALLSGIAAIPTTAAPVSTPEAASLFGAREGVLDMALSPDGKRVAIVSPGPGQATVVQVADVATGDAKAVSYANGNPLHITGCDWINAKRMLCTFYGADDREGFLQGYRRIMAFDDDGKSGVSLDADQHDVYFAASNGGMVIEWLDGKSTTLLVERHHAKEIASLSKAQNQLEGEAVERVDTNTGSASQVEAPDIKTFRYFSDGLGHVRIVAKADVQYQWDGKISFLYRKDVGGAWLPFSNYDTLTSSGMYPLAIDSTVNAAYVTQKLDGRQALYRVSLDGSKKTELVYAHPQVDVGGVVWAGRPRRVIGASFATEKSFVVYFDKNYEAVAAMLGKALPGKTIDFADASGDEKQLLIFAHSDVDPGRYYVFDRESKRLDEIAPVRPRLDDVALAEMKPITYTAADGTAIPAYLTLPPGSDGKHLPAIVMPHGGPSSRDHWGFDWLAQYWANRGFAVIQPNYRGSDGYGENWLKNNGFKSWRIAIGDVNDSAHWLVKQGIADPDKLAIFGWSYGGYAALQSQVLDPKLFKAVVAVAPVTDLVAMVNAHKGWTDYKAQRDEIGSGPDADAGSPARHADRFAVPVLLFHGTLDLNVDIAQSKEMRDKLRSAGKKVDLIVYPRADHQLPDSAIRIDMLAKSDAFLRAALKM